MTHYNPEFDLDSPYKEKYKYKVSRDKINGETDKRKPKRTKFRKSH
jgi:hypothetical protein